MHFTVGQGTPRRDAGGTGAITETAPERSARVWAAWSAAWGGVVVAAFVNGATHLGYATALGEPIATQLSEVVLPLLLAAWVIWVEHRHSLPTLTGAVVVGAG